MEDSLSKAWSEASFVVADLEGNGYQPPEIVELSVVRIVPPGVLQEPRTWLVRPEHKIARRVTMIHGISNKDVKGAPTFDDIRGEVKAQLGDHYFIAHYAHVDHEVLKRQVPEWEPKAVIDTARLAHRFLPGQPSYGLTAMIAQLGLEEQLRTVGSQPHRATYDALAAAHIFLLLCKTSTGMPRTLAEVLDAGQKQPSSRQGELFK
jgi:exodeoxyribonuclease X